MKFQFAPRYKEGAPDHLPTYEVLLGLCNRAAEKWLPMFCRIVAAIVLWLGMVPLITAYLYHGWMHRPSSILARLHRDLVAGDLISGAVIASFIIVTFLAFMSFADFLRFNWQGEEGGFQARRQPPPPEEDRRGDWDMAVVQLEIINRMKEYVSRAVSDHEDGTSLDDAEDRRYELQQMRDLVHDMERLIHPIPNEVPRTVVREQELQRHEQTRELLRMLEELEANNEEKREIASKAALATRALNNSLADVIREQEAEPRQANGNGEEADEAPAAAARVHRRQGQWDRLQRQAPPAAPVNNRFDRLDAQQNAGLNAEDVVSVSNDFFIDQSGPSHLSCFSTLGYGRY